MDLPYQPAVETEYRGVVFRSKSEAILARNFDLLGVLWHYEPSCFTQADLWKPDFWIIIPKKRPGFWSVVLEYKPADPTETYKSKLYKRFEELSKICPSAMALFVGSGFDSDKPRIVYEWGFEGWRVADARWLMKHLNEASRHRFDLKEAA